MCTLVQISERNGKSFFHINGWTDFVSLANVYGENILKSTSKEN